MKYLSLLIKPVSGMCNMSCRYCFYRELSDDAGGAGAMSRELCDALIKKAFSIAEEEVIFAFQGGEPLLAGPSFYRIFIETVNREKGGKKASYSIQTNGLLLNEEYEKIFLENDFLVGISLDGPRKIHDACRVDHRGEGTFYRVLNQAKKLAAAGVKVNILSVVTPKLAEKPEYVYDFFKKQGFAFLQFIPCMDSIRSIQGEGEDSLKDSQYLHFLNGLFACWQKDFRDGNYISIRHFDNWVRMAAGQPGDTCALSGQCGSYFVIERDGSVYPCDFYVQKEYLLGNIRDDDFQALLARLQESGFLTDYKEKLSSDCRECPDYDLCRGGCKRDWVIGERGGRTRYCWALREFFDANRGALQEIAEIVL